MHAFAQVLLDAGASRTPAMRASVAQLGKTFEFYREDFNPDLLAEADAGLEFLYATFDVEPAARRRVHDGSSPIAVTARTWQKQHQELWNLLVPGKGPARTVQGEVIRITGRISNEWEGNGGMNWDRDYATMASALVGHVQRGTSLAHAEVAEIESIARSLRESGGAGNARLAELAVAWVSRNPQPMELEKPSYRR